MNVSTTDTPSYPISRSRKSPDLVTLAVILACIGSLLRYWHDPRRPTAPSLQNGWWQFSDQGRYLRSTLAWAAGRLDPAEHWYMPGYPLLAAPFTALTHSNPFLFPDLACLAATLWLSSAIAGRLAPGWRWAREAGALATLIAVLPPLSLDVWVTPWTSTPEAVLTLSALLASLIVISRPASWRAAFCAGACAAGLSAFRPVDAALLSCVVAVAVVSALLRAWPGRALAVRTLAVTVFAAVVAVAPVVILYVAINGWQLNAYLSLSTIIGFEWRLLPLRWVTIMLSPRPLLPGGAGMIWGFPWIITGIVGMVACVIHPPAGGIRLVHIVVVGATCLHVIVYLCYRDLHPEGLWQYYNYHYFKWVVIVAALYSVLILPVCRHRHGSALVAGMAVLACLLPWRAQLGQIMPLPAATREGPTLRLPLLHLGVSDAVLIRATGSFDAIFNTQHNLYAGDPERWYSSTADFKTAPQSGGLMIRPLRPFAVGTVTIQFGPGVTLLDGPPLLARQDIVFGWPCWLPVRFAACAARAVM